MHFLQKMFLNMLTFIFRSVSMSPLDIWRREEESHISVQVTKFTLSTTALQKSQTKVNFSTMFPWFVFPQTCKNLLKPFTQGIFIKLLYKVASLQHANGHFSASSYD